MKEGGDVWCRGERGEEELVGPVAAPAAPAACTVRWGGGVFPAACPGYPGCAPAEGTANGEGEKDVWLVGGRRVAAEADCGATAAEPAPGAGCLGSVSMCILSM